MNIYNIFETKKGLYYNVNKRKKAGTSRSKNAPEAPSVADWKNVAKTAKEDINEGIEIVYELSEGAGQQLSVQQLAAISDTALDSAYGYGRSTPGNTFGWQANLKSASFAKQMIDRGVTDVEAISDAIHKGWNVTAQAFVKNPMQFDDSKTMAPEKLQAKLAQRQKLMTQQYAQLPEDEKEKDRVVARAMLQAITGQQGVAEGFTDTLKSVWRGLKAQVVDFAANAVGLPDDQRREVFVQAGNEFSNEVITLLANHPARDKLIPMIREIGGYMAKARTLKEFNSVMDKAGLFLADVEAIKFNPPSGVAKALPSYRDKQGVAEMDKSQKSPAGWNLDDYDYSKGNWTRGKIVTAKDAVKDMGKELNRAFNNTDPKDKEPGVTEADYEIHHHDPEGRLKARYHHGSEYTDDVIRKDADYHQKRNPKDTIKVFKDKKPMESQGVEESLRPGEYHVWTVHFEDGTKGRIRVPNDEITDDQIKAHYAKRGKTVVKIDADWAVHSLDEAPVSNFMTAPQQPIDPREQWKRQVRAMAAQYQRNPSMLASLAKEAGPDSVEQVAWEYLQSAAKGIRMPGADTQPAPVNWDDVIRRLPQGLSGQALLNAAEEYLTGTKGMLRSQVRTLLNEPTNQRSLKGAYDRKLQPSESIDELAEAIDSRLYAMKLAGYDIL